jgi:hypothetical protein
MGNIDYIWPVVGDSCRRGIERAVHVVEVVKAFDGPRRPGEEGARGGVVVPAFELLD